MANNNYSNRQGPRCSFCGKTQNMVERLVAGPNVYICNECIGLCNDILSEEAEYAESQNELQNVGPKKLPLPSEMKRTLDEYVIGQERAKKALSVAVYNHYKRINRKQKKNDVELQKSNILLLGPTGSGKTYLAQTLARILEVPFAIADATSVTEAGYVGDDVETILLRLIQAADWDIAKAQQGIIYIDEIDKIARKGENMSITRDVSGEGVQQALLKILEGTEAAVPPQGGRKHPHQEMVRIDTTNILFICGGAFDGLEKIVESRTGKQSIGFNAEIKRKEEDKNISELMRMAKPQDFIKYGLIPEFVGRVPVNVSLDLLNEDDLIRVLTEPKSAIIKQYKRLFELDHVDLIFEDEAVREIAHLSAQRDTGARGLRSIVEDVLMDIMFTLPSDETVKACTITKAVVDGEAEPVLTYRDDSEEKKTNRNKKQTRSGEEIS